MPGVPSRRPSYRWLTITLAVAAGVYGWYAVSQYYRLNDLNQRQLSNAGAELKTALDNAAETVRQFNDKWTRFHEKHGVMGPWPESRPLVCDFVRSQPYLRMQQCLGRPSGEVEWKTFSTIQWTTNAALELRVSNGEAEAEEIRYRTERLMPEFAFPDSFALIFIATEEGVVLFQDAPTRRRWLRHLRWGERHFRDAYADRPPTLQIHDVRQIVGGDTTWGALRSVSSRTTVELGGTDHLVYLQPLVLDSEEPITVIIGGAVPRSTIVRDALALGTPFLGILVFLILACVLGFPFVKLACLDRHERFGLWDVKLLYVSSGALLVLFTCAALALDGYTRWRLEADRGLVQFAAHLERQFLAEIQAVRDRLVEYDASFEQKAATRTTACEDWPVDTSWFGNKKPMLTWPEDAHLKTVSWIDPGGQQIWKSTADAVPGKLRVGHRVYFKAVRDGNLFQINGEGTPFFLTPDRSIADAKFYTFLSMRSRVAAARCADPNTYTPARSRGTLVIAATAQFLSLDRQPLPAGYGFALINREGRVLYHSDGRLSLRENLFEELSDGARARAMTYAGTRDGLDTRYRERPHRVHLHPVGLTRAADGDEGSNDDRSGPAATAGFYIATFRDRAVEQGLVGHVFVAGLIGPMALVLLLSLGGLAVLAFAGRKCGQYWSVWLWPHQGLHHIYRCQAVTLGVLLLVSIGLVLQFGTVAPFLLAPFFAVSIGFGAYWLLARRAGARGPLTSSLWQTTAVLLVLLCMVVVPSAAVFHVALTQEFAKLIVTEREWIRDQEDDWLRAAKAEALQEHYAPERAIQVLKARAQYLDCVPAPYDAPSPLYAPAMPATPPRDVLPASLETSTPRARHVLERCLQSESGAGLVHTLQPIGQVARFVGFFGFERVLPVEDDFSTRRLFQSAGQSYSPEGTLIAGLPASGTAFVGSLLLLAILCWWIQWNSKYLFLRDLDASRPAPSRSPDEVWADCTPDEQMVLVQIAREHIANPYQRTVIEQLLDKGLLRLAPDVRPYSEEFERFLRGKERELEAQIKDWQEVDALHSWRYWRLILIASVAAILFFLIATQPGLQSSVMAIATGITGVLTATAKLREAFSSWFGRTRTS